MQSEIREQTEVFGQRDIRTIIGYKSERRKKAGPKPVRGKARFAIAKKRVGLWPAKPDSNLSAKVWIFAGKAKFGGRKTDEGGIKNQKNKMKICFLA